MAFAPACAWFLAAAVAQAGPDDVAALIDQLDDSSFRVRAQADARLESRDTLTLRELDAASSKIRLSPEQRVRLRRIERAKFEREPRAAMGIRFDLTDGAGVVIVGTIDGFDAAKVLRAGDAITAIGGTPVSSQPEASAAIVALDPGEAVPVSIFRNGESAVVTVEMGRYRDLPEGPGRQGREVDPDLLARAWSVRLARLASNEMPADVADGGLGADAWQRAYAAANPTPVAATIPVNPLTGESMGSPLPPVESASLAPAGVSREDPIRADWAWKLARQGGADRLEDARRAAALPDDPNAPFDPAALQRRLAMLRERRTALSRDLSAVTARLGDQALAPEARMMLLLRRQEMMAHVAALDMQIEEITQRLRRNP